jgi:hypothetical protein
MLILFARYPVPGRAKTRLVPALGAEGAAALHRRLALRTLRNQWMLAGYHLGVSPQKLEARYQEAVLTSKHHAK